MAATTLRAKSSPPAPPFAHTSASETAAPACWHAASMAASSASLSDVKRLIATTTGSLKTCFMLWMCLSRLGKPRCTASTFSLFKSAFSTPPLYLRARTVATMTAQSGFKFASRALMSQNFSAPRSAPKPASVTANSPKCCAKRVANTELQPCAMLANGPPCTNAGLPASVCTKLGLMASLSRAAIAP